MIWDMRLLPMNGRISFKHPQVYFFSLVAVLTIQSIYPDHIMSKTQLIDEIPFQTGFENFNPIELPLILQIETDFQNHFLKPFNINIIQISCSPSNSMRVVEEEPIFSIQIKDRKSSLTEEIEFSLPVPLHTLNIEEDCMFKIPFWLPADFAHLHCDVSIGILRSSLSRPNLLRLMNNGKQGKRVLTQNIWAMDLKPLYSQKVHSLEALEGVYPQEYDVARERNFNWLTKKAVFTFSNPYKNVYLYMELMGFETMPNTTQLLIAGHAIDTFQTTSIPTRKLYSLNCKQFDSKSRIKVELVFQKSTNPKQAGLSNDNRNLSARMYYLNVIPK